MINEPIVQLSRKIEGNLWGALVDAPLDPMLVQDACALAAQLLLTSRYSHEVGTTRDHAAAFINETDNLALRIDALGGLERIADTYLADLYRDAAAFSDMLLDIMVAGNG